MPKRESLAIGFAVLALLSPTLQSQNWPAFVLYQKNGVADNDNFGFSVASAGDVNGDGKDDFIIGAYQADPGGISNPGAAYVYSGADGSLLYQKNGAAAGDFLGNSVASAGDVNGDGLADFIIGANGAQPGGLAAAGSAYVYSGADGSLLYQKDGTTAGNFLGNSVASAGDVNGDGRADFIIGAFGALSGTGSAYVYSGADGSLLYQKDGGALDDQLGNSVASAGDVNADGRADFIIGARFADPAGLANAGSAYVYSGADGSLLYQKDGAAPGDNLGISVAPAGDVNGDGRSDFIIGAYQADPGGLSGAGSAYVYSGATGGLLYQKNGAAAGDVLGISVAPAGDVNGDGRADFIIGANRADPGGISNAGSAYVFSGSDGSLLVQKNGLASVDLFGSSVASAGDVNGDGRSDIIVGAIAADPGGISNTGSAYVFQSGYGEKIVSIADVGGDQGRWARLNWKSLPGADPFVNQFALFRRVDPGFKVVSPASVFSGADFPPGSWEQVGTFSAFGDTIYQAAVSTVNDSTAQTGIQWSVFFVRAIATSNPLIFFDSPVDSGYSVDNLAPAAPSSLAAAGTCQATVKLSYSAPVDPDFQYFRIYRDTSADFSAPEVVGNTIDSFLVDATVPLAKTLYYRVRAVDFSGNEGNFSPQASGTAGLKGDLNGSGDFTTEDVVLAINAIFMGSPFDGPFCTADLNCDSTLRPSDVVLELLLVFSGTPITCTP